MLERRYELKGLDIKSSKVSVSPLSAIDCRNVQKNSNQEIVKRVGYEEIVNGLSVSEIFEYKKGERLVIHTAGIDGFSWIDKDNEVPTQINSANGGVVNTDLQIIDSDEYNGVLYFTSIKGLYKYDGYNVYKAGLPLPKVSHTNGAGAFSYRLYLKFQDAQNNVLSGDYIQFDNLQDNASFTVEQIGDEHYEKYGKSAEAAPFTITTLANTITVAAGHNYIAGDAVLLRRDNTFIDDPVIVESVTATTITFKISSMSGEYTVNPNRPLEPYRTTIVIAKSSNPSYGYEIDSTIITDTNTLTASAGSKVISWVGLGSFRFLEDEYDSTILKGYPPICKYICFYNNLMILGNRVFNPSDERPFKTEPESSFFWSDTGVGSTVETFPPFNTDSVGVSSEGEIAGVYANSDNVAVLKERQIYFVNGNLILNSYRIRSSLSNGVGCVSHKSIIEIANGFAFMSSRGFYHCSNGSMPVEISEKIEPMFTQDYFGFGLDLTTAQVINDIKNERMYAFIAGENNDIIVEYDYFYKEWFIHDNIPAQNGIVYFNDNVYHAGDSLYKWNDGFNDDGLAIDAWWKSGWETMGNPSLIKKFIKVFAITLSSLAFKLNITSAKDWDIANVDTDVTKDAEQYGITENSLNITQSRSISVGFRNNVIDEGMNILGYELISEQTQERPRSDK